MSEIGPIVLADLLGSQYLNAEFKSHITVRKDRSYKISVITEQMSHPPTSVDDIDPTRAVDAYSNASSATDLEWRNCICIESTTGEIERCVEATNGESQPFSYDLGKVGSYDAPSYIDEQPVPELS